MEPGQYVVRTGGLVAGDDQGRSEQLALGFEAPWSDRWSVTLTTAAYRRAPALYTRDTVISAQARVIDKPNLALRVAPGISLPSGSANQGFAFTPLSTGSADPWLSADVVWGAAWLLAASAQGRVSLYDGLDGTRQRPYGTVTLKGARRLGRVDGVPWIGAAGSAAPGQFAEVAAVGGFVWAPNERWALSADARVPIVGNYDWAVGLGIGRIFGEAAEGHEH